MQIPYEAKRDGVGLHQLQIRPYRSCAVEQNEPFISSRSKDGWSLELRGSAPVCLGWRGPAPRKASARWECENARGDPGSAAAGFAGHRPSADTGREKRGEAGGRREAGHGVEVRFRIFVLPVQKARQLNKPRERSCLC